MKTVQTYCLLLMTLFIVVSCGKDDNSEISTASYYGADYFPDDSGLIRYYHVDSAYWDDFTGTNGVVSFEIKEVLAGHFIDDQGRNAIRIERYKQDSTGNWVIYRVWSALRTQNSAEVVEENTRYVKLRFPAAQGSTWNGNIYNTEGEQDYEILSIDVPETTSGLNFTQSLHVQEEYTRNLVEDKQKETKYAKFVGPYYKLKSSLTFASLLADTSGYIYKEKLTSYSLP